MIFHSEGKTTKQTHKGIPEGQFEEEQGRLGFFGPVTHLLRKKPSTRWKKIDGKLRPHLYDLNALVKAERHSLFSNGHVEVGLMRAQKSSTSAFRNADGDTIYFAHSGKGVVLTEFGAIDVRRGDYLVMPKCVAHQFLVEEPFFFLTIESKQSPYSQPQRGIAGQQAVYDPHAITRPSLELLAAHIAKTPEIGTVVDVKYHGEQTRFEYEETTFDVVGWRGTHYPFTLNIGDIMPLMSHRAHLPPSAHTTFVAEGFVVCSFVPRPLESDSDALRVPFYHQNIDYDEILFYHDGDFFSRSGLKAGMLTLHPAGFPHGPHPKAIEKVKSKTHTDEYAVMVDTRVPLTIHPEAERTELPDYWKSWM